MIKQGLVSILILATLAFTRCHTTNIDVYISPLGNDTYNGTQKMPVQTIKRAFEIVGEIRKKTDEEIIIHLVQGDYHLDFPILIAPESNNISMVREGSQQVRIKGSKILHPTWEAFNENIWVADIQEEIDFNQLFINGEKQILARYPNFDINGGAWQGHAADAISKERVNGWKNPQGGFVHAMHSGRWGDFHYQITGVDQDGVVTLIGGHQNNRPSVMHPKQRMVENIFEELDSEKEWFYDKQEKKLYLWPTKKIDIDTAIVEVSILKNLIDIRGDRKNPVKNVSIEGVRFEHAMNTFMEEYHPLLRSDWTIYRGGAITLDGTEDCSINDCEFANLGGNVIFINGYNRNTQIASNHIHHCGASAICFVGDTTAVRSPSFQYNEFVPNEDMDTMQGPANDLYPSEGKVENNLIYNIGEIEKQVAGVQVSMAMKIHIKNNSIYDVPRAGINVSEGTWGGHIIEYNDVFNTVLESSDHGAFNSWGRDRFWHPEWKIIDSLVHSNPKMPYWDAIHTTIIRNNRFRCDHGWDIDLDDGSSNYHIYDNLCLNGGIKLREGFYRVVENNILVNNGFHPHVWFSNSEDVFRKNILMTKHFPIRLEGWGKEVDYNIFPDSIALALAQENNIDAHSVYGNPGFNNPERGDFTVEQNSIAHKVGFRNIPMDKFGVQKDELKAIAKQPDIPELNIQSFQKAEKTTRKWLGGILKNIVTPEEQSASGLFNMDGVLILKVEEDSKLLTIGLREGDVIVGIDGEKVKNIADLLSKYQGNLWKGNLKMNIIRSQKELEVRINTQ